MTAGGYKIDIGCGPLKRPGYLGIDSSPHPGVDHVIDVEKDPLPFPDGSVAHVFSSHCLEHLRDPERFFREIARVAQDGAEVEIWTPYAFSNGAFIFSHVQFLNEDHYAHMCILFPDAYKSMTGAFWNWKSITYVVPAPTVVELDRAGVPLEFAIRYYKNVVLEFGVCLKVVKNASHKRIDPQRYFSIERDGARYGLRKTNGISPSDVQRALRPFQR